MTKKKTTKSKSKKAKPKTVRFIASRWTIFPSEITIDKLGVTVKDPGLFSGKETTMPFSRISHVDIICPSIGHSTITIHLMRESKKQIFGFTNIYAKKVKELISAKLKKRN